jgi:hypothetical protein
MPGWEAFLLSHIKAPAQGGKAGGGKPPGMNLAKLPPRINTAGVTLRAALARPCTTGKAGPARRMVDNFRP